MPDADGSRDSLADVVRAVAALSARVAALERPRLKADQRLYCVLVDRIGLGRVFSAAAMLRFAAHDPPLALALASFELRTALRLGRRLGRLGRGGYVRAICRNDEGVVWTLCDVAGLNHVTTSSTR